MRQLRARGDEVACLVRTPEKATKLTELGCELVAGDLGDAEALRKGMEGCDGLIHAAAMYEVGIPAKQHPAMYEANVRGSERVLQAALEARVGKVVYVSTVGTFGNTHGKVVDETYEHPGKDFTSYYEETKLEGQRIAERMIAEEGLPVRDRPARRRLRPRRHFAGRRPARGVLRRQAAPAALSPSSASASPTSRTSPAASCSRLDKGKAGETYVISGPATTMREAIETVASLSGRKAPKRAHADRR